MLKEMSHTVLHVYDIFYFDKECSAELNIEKASVNQDNLFRVYETLKLFKSCKSIAFYGDREEISSTLLKMFDRAIHIDRIDQYPATLWCLLIDEICIFILACESDILFIPKPFNRESLLVTLQKFLQDLCKDIIILPGDKVLNEWTLTDKNPFYHTIDTDKVQINQNNNIKLEIDKEDLECHFDEDITDNNGKLIIQSNYSRQFFKINKNEEKEIFVQKFSSMLDYIFLEQIKLEKTNMYVYITKLQHRYPGLIEGKFMLSLLSQFESFNLKLVELENNFCFNHLYKQVENILHYSGNNSFWYDRKVHKYIDNRLIKSNLVYMMKSLFTYYDSLICKYYNIDKLLFDIIDVIVKELNLKDFSKIDIATIKNNANEYINNNVDQIRKLFDKYLIYELEILITNFKSYLDSQKINLMNNNSLVKFYEITQYMSANVINDGTKKFKINTCPTRKLIIDEKIFNEKFFISSKLEDPIKNCELINIFPVLNERETNIIIFQYKNLYNNLHKQVITNFYLLICSVGENFRKLTEFSINLAFFHYYPNKQTLFIFDYEKLDILKYRYDDGKLNKIGEYNYKEKTLGYIKSCVYIEIMEKFIVVNTEGNVYHLCGIDNFKSKPLPKIGKVNGRCRDNLDMISTSGARYDEVLYPGSGSYYALKYNDGIDFYSFDNKSNPDNCLQIKNIKFVKVFTDRINSYLLIFTASDIIAKLLPRYGANCEYKVLNKTTEVVKGNPIVDYIYSGYLKFGQTTGFEIHNYHFYNESLKPEILKYSETLFKGTALHSACLNTTEDILNILDKSIFNREMIIRTTRMLLSRVPIQICTLENENIYPLIDGKRINITGNFSKVKKIEEKAKFLSFGYIEHFLKDITDPAFLCCIIGKQSSGKSYLMNRIFDTRFDVRTTRCTDGIWMSYSYLEGNIIIVFDCEGLFSRQRKPTEEVKLLAFLAAVCDFTYLNQDLSFDRHLNELLASLCSSKGRLQGENLFKGKLNWTVRDIKTDCNKSALNEFISHIDSYQKNGLAFLNNLFDSTIIFTCMNNFQNPMFKSDIEKCRSDILEEIKARKENNTIHWSNGSELIKSIKLAIVQSYVDDNTNIEILEQEFTLNEIKENLIEIWKNPNKYKGIINTNYSFYFIRDETKITFSYNVSHIVCNFMNIQEDVNNIIAFYQNIMKDKGIEHSKQTHLAYYNNCNEFLIQFLKIRKGFICSVMNETLNKYPKIPSEKRNNFIRDFESNIIGNINYDLCLNKCVGCNLKCIKPKCHRKLKEERLNELKKELSELQYQNIDGVEVDIDNLNVLKTEINALTMEKDKILKQMFKLDRLSEYQTTVEDYMDNVDRLNKELELSESEIAKYKSFENVINMQSPVYYYLADTINNVNKKIICDGIEDRINEIRPDSTIEDIDIIVKETQNDIETKSNLLVKANTELDQINVDLNKNLDILKNIQNDIDKSAQQLNSYNESVATMQKEIFQINAKLKDLNNNVASYNYIELSDSEKNIVLKLEEKKYNLDIFEKEYLEILSEYENSYDFDLDVIIKKYFEIEIIEKQIQAYHTINEQLIQDNEVLNNQIANLENEKMAFKEKVMGDDIEYKHLNAESNKISQSLSANNKKSKQIEKMKKQMISLSDKIADKLKSLDEALLSNNEYVDLINEANQRQDLLHYNHNIYRNNQQLTDSLIKEKREIENLFLKLNYKDNNVFYKFQRNWFNEDFTECLNTQIGEYSNTEDFPDNSLTYRQEVLTNFNNYVNEQKQTLRMDIEQNNDIIFYREEMDKINNEINELQCTRNKISIDLTNQKESISELNNNIDKLKTTLAAKELKYSRDNDIKIDLQHQLEVSNSLLTDPENIIKTMHEDLNLKKSIILKLSESIDSQNSLLNDVEHLKGQIVKAHEELALYTNLQKNIAIKNTEKNEFLLKIHNLKEENSDISDFRGNVHKIQENLKTYINKVNNKTNHKQKLMTDNETLISKRNKKFELESEKAEIDQEINNSCDCLTDHLCNFPCKSCPEVLCSSRAGHDGVHICIKPYHSCEFECDIDQCQNSCRKELDHKGEHICDDSHQCKSTCNICSESCNLKMTDLHSVHKCKTMKCKKKCILCIEECNHNNHFHDNITQHVTIEDNKGNIITVKDHLCGKEHNCEQVCNSPGVCYITYEELPKEYIDHNGRKCNYVYFKPISDNKKCVKLVKTYQAKHDSYHSCENQHRCDMRCPECGSVCKHEYGHPSSIEHDFFHRNKEFSFFTNTTGEDIIIEDKKGKRAYKIKDQAIVETCDSSCQRRGRGHIHLLKCEGEIRCRSNLQEGGYIVHSNKIYNGFEDEQFDEINCIDFWELFNIRNPLKQNIDHEDLLNSVNYCCYYCPYCCKPEKNLISFCSDILGHSQSDHTKDHDFKCDCKDVKKIYKGLDLCFVMDITGSMGKYIDKSTESINNIIKHAVKYLYNFGASLDSVKVGIVCYKDHNQAEDIYPVTYKQDFSTPEKAVEFLSQLKAGGGEDGHEAVVDGLSEALKLTWRSETDKIMFLIIDYPLMVKYMEVMMIIILKDALVS
jgi:hypothetical protein